MAPIFGDAAAPAAATASIVRSPIGKRAFGRSAPRRFPAPAASRMAAARAPPSVIAAAWQKPSGSAGWSGTARESAGTSRFEVREDHPAGRRLQDVSDLDLYLAADELGGVLHDDHRAVVEVPDPLAVLPAVLHEPDDEFVPRRV